MHDSAGATARTGNPGIADQDSRPPRDSGDLRATEHRQDRAPARPATESATESAAGSAAGSAGATGHSDLASNERRPDSTRRHEPVDHGTHVAHGDAAPSADVTGDERLFSARRARDYAERWDTLQLDFVDDPRRAIAEADQLVGDILSELKTLFADQRRQLDRDLDSDRSSTEDLRVALGRYRDFFNRLLSL
ncbi:MAG TPA: hypothetical protein VFE65_00185 [Pseudonocardia sp.]|nr:hypothetical protein [Pseudonocardia sp.]